MEQQAVNYSANPTPAQRSGYRLSTIGYRLAVLLVLLLLVGSTAPLAAQSPAGHVRIDRVETTEFPTVELLTTVTNAQGQIVPGLGAEAFTVQVDGAAVPLIAVDMVPPAEVMTAIVLAIDISNSIDAETLARLQQATTGFIGQLSPNDQLALVLFGTDVQVVQALTTDHGAVINSINALTIESLQEHTALYRGALQSVQLAAVAPVNMRRAVVLLTDSPDSIPPGTTPTAIETVITEARNAQVPVYVIGVGPAVEPEPLRRLALDGRFQAVGQFAPEQLDPAFSAIVTQLHMQYALRVMPMLDVEHLAAPLVVQASAPAAGVAAQDDVPLSRLLPETPYVPSPTQPITMAMTNTLTFDIFWQHEVQDVALLLDDAPVLSATLTSPVPRWNITWVPSRTTVISGDHNLALRVSDGQGMTAVSAAQSVRLVDPPPAAAPALLDNGLAPPPVPLWVWLLVGTLLVLVLLVLTLVLVRTSRVRQPVGGAAPPPGSKYHSPPTSLTAPDGPVYGAPSPQAPAPWPPPPTQADYRVPEPPPAAAPSPAAEVPATAPLAPPPAEVPATAPLVPPAQAPTAPEPAAQAVPAYQRAQLVVERGTGRPQSLTLLAEQEVVIGRGPQANLVLDDQRVSARHAQICFRENGFMIVDLHSRNGLLVNNYRVDKLRLQHNDRVQLGETVLVFQQPREMGEG